MDLYSAGFWISVGLTLVFILVVILKSRREKKNAEAEKKEQVRFTIDRKKYNKMYRDNQ